MISSQRNNATGTSPLFPSNQSHVSATTQGLSTEAIVAIAFGIAMFILAILGLWQSQQYRRHLGSQHNITALHERWFGSLWSPGLDVRNANPGSVGQSMATMRGVVVLAY